MGTNVFISFRFSDGNQYKEELVRLFDSSNVIHNCSEDKDRSNMSEGTIQKYLYEKLKRTSVTIVLLTPEAINHHKSYLGYNDWMYDEIRYSLENRVGNRMNGLIAVYTPEAKQKIITEIEHSCSRCNSHSIVDRVCSFDNLVRANMMNIYPEYKKSKCSNIYDSNWDSYCSLISWDEFVSDFEGYISIATEKRENASRYEIVKRL